MSERQLTLRVVTAFAAIYLIWGSTYLAIRFAIETLPPLLMAGTRHLTAGVLLYLWARHRGAARPEGRHWKSAAAVGALLLLGGNGLVVWAETRVPSGLTALLVAMVPLWMVLLDWLWQGGRPAARTVFGLACGFAGVVILVGPRGFGGASHVDPLGAAALVVASLSWATGSLLSRRVALPASPFLATAMEMLAGGACLVVTGLALGEAGRVDLAAASARSWLALAYLVVLGSLVGFTAYVWLLRTVSASRASTYAYVNPVVAVLLGWALAGEPLSARTLLAAAMILPAVAVLSTARPRPAPAAALTVAEKAA